VTRDRDASGRPRNARPRDELGRPLPRSDAASPAEPDPPALPPDDALRTAQRLLDEGHAFTAHEVLEARWKDSSGSERALWRGLAQLAVGITHAQRGNSKGARALLDRSVATLAPFAGLHPHGVDVDGVRSWAAAADPGPSVRGPRLCQAAEERS
jgi:hypothetical protein